MRISACRKVGIQDAVLYYNRKDGKVLMELSHFVKPVELLFLLFCITSLTILGLVKDWDGVESGYGVDRQSYWKYDV